MKSRAINGVFIAGITVLGLFACATLQAQAVDVKDAWARATVPGQKATGAFMKITAKEGLKLVGGTSAVAGVTEVHEIRLEGDVMRMRAVSALELPAGQTVELKPGGYHLMLMDLKAPLAKDSKLPLTLIFKDAKGGESRVELMVPVGMAAPGGMPQHQH